MHNANTVRPKCHPCEISGSDVETFFRGPIRRAVDPHLLGTFEVVSSVVMRDKEEEKIARAL